MLRIFRIKAIELHLVHKKQNFSSEVISGGGHLLILYYSYSSWKSVCSKIFLIKF